MEINNVMKDVRSAFRLLAIYQQNIVQLVHYMKGQFGFSERLMGHKLYSRALSGVQDEHASQNVHAGMWGWDFLYGYMYEYYTGWRSISPEGNGIRMSFIQVSDDGYAISKKTKSRIDIYNKYEKEEESHSYIIMCFMYSNKIDKQNENEETDKNEEKDINSIGCFVNEARESDFIIEYLSGMKEYKDKEKDGFYIDSIDDKVIYVMKKYPMENFIDQESTDNQIRDFKGFVNGEMKKMHPKMEEIFKME